MGSPKDFYVGSLLSSASCLLKAGLGWRQGGKPANNSKQRSIFVPGGIDPLEQGARLHFFGGRDRSRPKKLGAVLVFGRASTASGRKNYPKCSNIEDPQGPGLPDAGLSLSKVMCAPEISHERLNGSDPIHN